MFLIIVAGIGYIYVDSIEKEEQPTIRFGYKYTPVNIVGVVAVEKGFFEEEGLKVEPMTFSYGSDIINSFISDKVDLGLASADHIVVIASKEAPIKVIANNIYGGARQKIVVKTGLKVETLEDLIGLKIGTNIAGSAYKDFLKKLATMEGLSEDKFTTIHLKEEDLVPALASGKVDALIGGEITSNTVLLKGIGYKLTDFGDVALDPNGLFIKESLVKEHPDLVRKIVRAWIKAQNYVKENPNEAVNILHEAGDVDTDIIWAGFNDFTFDYHLTPQIKKDYEEYADFLLSNGKIKNKPNLDLVIDETFIESVEGAT